MATKTVMIAERFGSCWHDAMEQDEQDELERDDR